jgi:hypothetical protein
MMRVACIFAVVCSVGVGPVLADSDTSLDDAAKKTGQGFGNLLKGMGQELKKVGGSLTSSENSDKKDSKKEEKTKDDKAEANSEKTE